jgi:hypothetical protein
MSCGAVGWDVMDFIKLKGSMEALYKGTSIWLTEGDKVKMSQRKTPNAKRKTQKQPHMAPHPQKIVSNLSTLIYMGIPA